MVLKVWIICCINCVKICFEVSIWNLDGPWTLSSMYLHGSLTRYAKFRVAHASGMPGTLSPPSLVSDPDMHHGTCVTHVLWCIPGSLTSGILWSRRRGKRSRHSRRMRNPQFGVSGKRPICPGTKLHLVISRCIPEFGMFSLNLVNNDFQWILSDRVISQYQGQYSNMMTSSNGNIFCFTGPLWMDPTCHRWIPPCNSWTNAWANNRDICDMKRHRAHYGVTVMKWRTISSDATRFHLNFCWWT